MRRRILIFGEYPTEKNIKDGMIQRIKAIDDELGDYYRIYVTISCQRLGKKEVHANPSVVVYSLNLFIHYIFVLSLLRKVDAIYFHSILNYKYAILYPLSWVKKRFLDFHGAVPEEYQFLGGKRIKCKIINWLERRAIKECNRLICVSYNMRSHFLEKYPFSKGKYFIIKPIVPINSLNEKVFSEEAFKKEKGISDNATIIIYSGNLQTWQNFDLMVDLIKATETKKYVYIILTGERQNALKKICEKGCNMKNIIIDSVQPQDLYKYYSIAHYGFLLRDDHVLNKVAAPTKLVEYLYYGIIPILKYKDIGDQEYYHYEYVSYDLNDMKNLLPRKSSFNKDVSRKILNLASKSLLHI